MLWIILLLIVAVLFWRQFVWPLNHFTRIGVKQTTPIPLLGDIWRVALKLMSFTEFLKYIYDLYPNARYVGFYQGSTPTLVIRDPELIKILTIKDFDHFTDHRMMIDPKVDPFWSSNLFALRGQRWKNMRSTLSMLFTSSKMKHMFEVINETAETFANNYLDKNEDVVEEEMKETFAKYTNDVIATTAFGVTVDSIRDPNNEFFIMARKLTDFTGFKNKIKFLFVSTSPFIQKLFKVKMLDPVATKYFQSVIHETITLREKENIFRKDLLQLLMDNRHQPNDLIETSNIHTDETSKLKTINNITFSEEELTAQAMLFFFAGFETVSRALCFAAHELAVNKPIQDRLRNEIDKTHKEANGKLTYEVVNNMKYLDMVVSETLRKWSPGVVTDRVCTKPYTIQPVNDDEKPVHLKVGDLINLPLLTIQMDEKYYPNPEEFNPDRFSDENKEKIMPYTYGPFGWGPRVCIANRFALLEVKVLLYHLLRAFELVPTEKTDLAFKLSKSDIMPRPEKGFWLGFKRIK